MRFATLIAFTALIFPGLSQADVVLLDQGDLVQTRWPGIFAAPNLDVPPPDTSRPAVRPDYNRDGASILRSLIARGQAQGFGGILYENRDRDHSRIPADLFPNLTRLRYGPVLSSNNLDYGAALRVVINRPLIGNSSTALTSGYRARSQSRLTMTAGNGPLVAFLQFASNSLYIYPEHHDHDAIDKYPANWLYTLNSQGSSGSDREFIIALLMTLAAFPPETRAFLEQNNLLVQTLQLILRRNLLGVESESDFMSAKAHPSAFEKDRLRPGRMVSQAAALDIANIPPVVSLRMEEEDFSETGGLGNLNERLFDTPASIARLWRGLQWEREFIVDARQTRDPNDRELKFFWRILRGDPQKITIEPLDDTGSRARIRVMWHDAYPAPPISRAGEPVRQTSRIEIGVFAYNGVMISAPSFVNVHFPTHQSRSYGKLPDGSVRLLSVDYNARSRSAFYDPALYWSANWVDHFDYDGEGFLTGWTRKHGDQTLSFEPDGRLSDGREVIYAPAETKNTAPDLLFRIVDQSKGN